MRAKLLVFATACLFNGYSGASISAQDNSDFEVVWKKMMGDNEEDYTRHVVRKGETLFGLSRKYGVTLEWTRNNNPYTRKRTLQIGDVLLFPSKSMRKELGLTDPPEKVNQRSRYDRKEALLHVIDSKETLYSISRRYGVTVDELLATNPVVDQNTIHVSDTLMIPLKLRQKSADTSIKDAENNPTMTANFTHVVSSGETLWSLSQKYGVDVKTVVEMNPGIVSNIIGLGDTLAILPQAEIEQIKRGTKSAPEYTEIVRETKQRAAKRGVHIVSAGESIFGIAQQYETSLEDLRNWNYLDSDELVPGQRLMVKDMPVSFFDEDTRVVVVEEEMIHEAGSSEPEGRITKEVVVPDGATKVSVVGVDEESITVFDLEEDEFRNAPGKPVETAVVKEVVFEEVPDVEVIFEDELPVEVEELEGDIVLEDEVVEGRFVYAEDFDEPGDAEPEPIVRAVEEASDEPVSFFDEPIDAAAVEPAGEISVAIEEKEASLEEALDENTRMIIHDVDYSQLKPIYHMVESHETLEMISRQYNQQVLVLKEWNELPEASLDGRPRLVIGWYLPTGAEAAKSSGSVTPKATAISFRQQYLNASNNQLKFKKVASRGICTWLKDNSKHDENLYVLHKDAPRESIVRITNPLNRKTIYAKVIGKLPATSSNDGINMKLSFAVVKKLGLLDDRFMLEWNYYQKR